MATVSLFQAIENKYVVASDSFLDMIVTWNGSGTFEVYYCWTADKLECIDCFTNYDAWENTSATEAGRVAKEYFNRIYEEKAEQCPDYEAA